MPDYCAGVLLAWQIGAIEAASAGFNSIEPEHVLIGLCKVDQAISTEKEEVLQRYFGDIEHLYLEQDELDQWFAAQKIDRAQLRRMIRRINGPGTGQPGEPNAYVHRSERCQRMFNRAGQLAIRDGATELHCGHLLRAMIDKPTRTIRLAFEEQGVTLQDAGDEEPDRALSTPAGRTVRVEPDGGSDRTILGRFGTDLTLLARQGKIEPLIGRRRELVQLVRTLSRKSKNNPILLGDPGVGKTALVRGLAARIAEGKVPAELRGVRIVELSMASLVAGTKYRGDFEERLTGVVNESKADRNLILFLDEIHTMVSAGAAEGALDAANILKPALSQGDMRCIGSTTVAEYRRYFERDAALVRRFQPITINEPTTEETLAILRGVREKYERHHQVKIEECALDSIIQLTARYLPDRYFPDKALDVLDESCTLAKFGSVSSFSFRAEPDPAVVTEHVVAKVVSEMAGVPIGQPGSQMQLRLENVEEALRERVIGQDRAINRVSNVIKVASAGLRDKRKPMGVFLFAGPTGVGKTELARSMAELLFGSTSQMIRLDMSEYKEKHSVAKLIGAPPGYVGYDDEGQLTGKLRTKPHCLVLFDEIEKAHPEVFDLFLQLFDEGRLTDSRGRTVDARHSVFVMTTNAVTRVPRNASHRAIGFAARDSVTSAAESDSDATRTLVMEALGATFRPEFLNRIDEIILFDDLNPEDLRAIALKMLNELAERIEERGITVQLDDAVAEFICQQASRIGQGARPMARLVETLVGVPLGKMIISNKLLGGTLRIFMRDGQISFATGSSPDATHET